MSSAWAQAFAMVFEPYNIVVMLGASLFGLFVGGLQMTESRPVLPATTSTVLAAVSWIVLTPAGSAVTVTIRNYDIAAHSFVAPKLGLNVMLPAGTAAHPRVTTFTFIPPGKGTFTWTCAMNCDPFAMTHIGYMRGRITVV